MPNMWQYESFVLHQDGPEGPEGPRPEDVREKLNGYGKTGYQVIHIKERTNGSLMFIMARDTGRPMDEDEDNSKDWLVDVVTGADAHLAGRD